VWSPISDISSASQVIVQEAASSVQKVGRSVVVNEVPKLQTPDHVVPSGSCSSSFSMEIDKGLYPKENV
jgi:hypothetical protein